MKNILIISVVMLFAAVSKGQDHLYSQFLNSPLYLNPALAGTAENDLRFGMNYRRQWTSVPSGMHYYSAFADKYLPVFEGGVGAMFTNSNEGYLQKQNVAAMYSRIFCFDDLFVSVGIEGGVSNRAVKWNKLYFSDMIDEQGVIPGAQTQADLAINNSKWFGDIGAGVVGIYGNSLIGVSFKHLNRPDESLTNNLTSRLPRRLIVHASRVFETNIHEDNSARIIPSAVFYKQGQFRSVSAGVEFKNNFMNLGVWFRNNLGIRQNDAIVVSVTFDSFLSGEARDKKLRMGISHDATTSRLGYTRTTGSTEGAVLYEILTREDLHSDYRCNNAGGGYIPCYKF